MVFVSVLFGVFGKRYILVFATVAEFQLEVCVRHGKSVQFLDTVHVVLRHGTLRYCRRILIVYVVRRHHASKSINYYRHSEKNEHGQQ